MRWDSPVFGLDPFTSYRNNRNCSTCFLFFNKGPTKNVYLVIIYKKTLHFGESKIIEVHYRGGKMYLLTFSDMLFWEACATNVKYYKS
jgi:hypothetical protein